MSFIGDDIGSIVQAMRTDGKTFAPYSEVTITNSPYFMYGHRLEIANRLTEKEKGVNSKKQKFPLIALKQDIAETVQGDVVEYRLNIVIATYTDLKLNSEQRQAQIISVILEPLYQQFLRLFKRRGLFMWQDSLDQIYPPHTKYSRPYWGTPNLEQNLKNIFNDPLDAIELEDFRFNKLLTNCN